MICGVIPARYNSERFPGKPLAKINGKPMFWWVWQAARNCDLLESVVVATDDIRIYDAAQGMDVPVVMTSVRHQSGTERVFEVASDYFFANDNDVVVNIQGDEPLLKPEMITQAIMGLLPGFGVSTLAYKIISPALDGSDYVKVVTNRVGAALYFSRAVIPYDASSALYHVGVYVYRMSFLRWFIGAEPTPLEKEERLEQLRFLENNVPVNVVTTKYRTVSVDRPADISIVEESMKEEIGNNEHTKRMD